MRTFVHAMAVLGHWMESARVIRGLSDESVKITIEVGTLDQAAALLRALKQEFTPLLSDGAAPRIELDEPMRFMGMGVLLTLKAPREPVVPERVAWPGQAGYERQMRGRFK